VFAAQTSASKTAPSTSAQWSDDAEDAAKVTVLNLKGLPIPVPAIADDRHGFEINGTVGRLSLEPGFNLARAPSLSLWISLPSPHTSDNVSSQATLI
jgi:hypothetical protein